MTNTPRLAPPSPRNGNQLPPGPGRPKGSLNKSYLYIRKLCQSLLESEEYVNSVKRRIIAGTLPPAVEVLFHHYAWGKPKDVIDVTLSSGPALKEMTPEQLAHEAAETARAILDYKREVEEAALHNIPNVSDEVM